MSEPVFNVARVAALPPVAERIPATMYIVKGVYDLVELYFTAQDSGAVYHVLDSADVATMIENKLSSEQPFVVVANIAARNQSAVDQVRNAMYYVVDATGDSSVASGGALYAWNVAGRQWFKIMEYEGLDSKPKWSDLVDGPNVTVEDIEAAVAAKHTHNNMALLDLLAEQDNSLYFRGKPVDKSGTNGGVILNEEGW